MTLSRRAFLGTTGVAGLALATARCAAPPDTGSSLPLLDRPAGSPESVASDEAYWSRVAAYYRVPAEYTNMEAGYFGMMAAPVLAEYHRQVDRANFESSHFARRTFGGEASAAQARAEEFIGAEPGELVFTRNATEALQRLIVQFNKLTPGDVVMYADLDYNAMQYAMDALVQLRGVTVATFDIPEPATHENILAAYAAAFAANPRTKLLLLTHLNNKTGLIVPVKEIVALARERGADTIVDAAHSFGQVDLKLADMGADFVGLNLHKWIGAPVGVGAMYIKGNRLPDIDRMLGDPGSLDRIDSRMHTGTANFATYLTVPTAIDFHESIGSAYKAARVRYLRDQWVAEVRGVAGIDVLVPDDPTLGAAIASFRLSGRTSREDNQAIVQELFDQHQIFTVWRTGIARGDCIRVTPALYNTPADCARLASALKTIAARGV